MAQGKALFQSKGCAVCHDPNAEGNIGPALADKIADQAPKQVRTPKGGVMPAFPPSALSNDELQAIIAFIESLK